MWIKIAIAVLLVSSMVGCVVAPDHGSNRGHADRGFGQYHHSSDDRNQKANNHRHADQRSHGNNKYRNHSDTKHWHQGRHRD